MKIIKCLRQTLALFIIVCTVPLWGNEFRPFDPYGQFAAFMKDIRAAGITEIRGRAIDEILKRAKDVVVVFETDLRYQSLEDSANGVYRSSGYWNKVANFIALSGHHMNTLWRSPNHRLLRTILAHEYFGVLGIDDDNFSTSSLMQAIVIVKDSEINAQRKGKQLVKNQKNYEVFKQELLIARDGRGGGTSGVGGGGDGRIAAFLSLLYTEFFFDLDLKVITPEQFGRIYEFLSALDIQFSYSVKQGEIEIYPDKLLIVVPANVTSEENLDKSFAFMDILKTALARTTE